ncbi:hypothetical protein B0H10DRAFT_2221198 [Mycena sp. CBHHK59/15]|nr:hypothetical protein B0H10DRAFT_2221198 [Mycena sp. CBHHK59/15]
MRGHHLPGQQPGHVHHALGAVHSGVAAYNPTLFVTPPVLSSTIVTTIPMQLSSNTPGISIKQKGSFIGFSIKMSVANQVLAKNSSFIQVPFLNLMANIQQHTGSVMIHIGSNTQELAKLINTLPDRCILEKNLTGVTCMTQTPLLNFTYDMLYLMRNISSFVNVHWFLSVPWFVTQLFNPCITCMDNATTHMACAGHMKNILIGLNIANFMWMPEQVWNMGFVDTYNDNLTFLAVEKYPNNNCGMRFGVADIVDPQMVLPNHLMHNTHVNLLKLCLNSTLFAQTKNKLFLMFETNMVSCGSLLGILDSFTATLWGIDYVLQFMHSNFSGTMFHLGRQNIFYNIHAQPFTLPPTSQSTFHQWTIRPLYYSALIMAEALGTSNNTHSIYKDGMPVRIMIINYVNDLSSATDVQAVISAVGSGTPAQVKVKYLAAVSIMQQGRHIWAGQMFSRNFESDRQPMGAEDVQMVQCDMEDKGAAMATFLMTVHTKTCNTVLLFLPSCMVLPPFFPSIFTLPSHLPIPPLISSSPLFCHPLLPSLSALASPSLPTVPIPAAALVFVPLLHFSLCFMSPPSP